MHRIFILFFIILLSCSSSNKTINVKKIKQNPPPEKIYNFALKDFEEGKLDNAVKYLKIIETDYSYSNFAPKSILMISYIYYEANDYINSLTYLKKFKKIYPANKNLDYVEFLIALCLYEQINFVSRSQSTTLLALKQFANIIEKYPKSIYANESKIKIDLINEQLAGHEMYVARYYINKQRWASAILRLQTVIEKYQKTIFIDEALHRMVEINYKIGNIEAAKKYASILGYNFNNSEWYKRTYKIVGDKDYSITKQESKKSLKDRLLSIFNFNKND